MQKLKRPDPITNPHDIGSADAEAIYAACRVVDAVAAEMESKWGTDRLPSLVSVETAAKFGRAKAQFDAAITEGDVAAVTKKAAAMARGWKVLDAEATLAGAKEIDVTAWVHRHPENGKPFTIVHDHAAAEVLKKQKDFTAQIYTIDEVVRILDAFDARSSRLVGAIKDEFPGARVVDIRAAKKADAFSLEVFHEDKDSAFSLEVFDDDVGDECPF